MHRKNLFDILALIVAGIGILLFTVMPLVASRNGWAAFPYVLGRGDYVALIGLIFIVLALTGSALVAGVCIWQVDLYRLSTRPGALTTLLAVLRLNYTDNHKALSRLGIVLAGGYLLVLLVLSFDVGDRLDAGFPAQFIFVGLPLLALAIMRVSRVRSRLGGLFIGRTFYLDIQYGTLIGGQPRLPKEGLTIGRDEYNDIVLFDDRYVMPRQHAALHVQNGGVVLTIYSQAYTYINRQQVPPGEYLIPPETTIQIGQSVFKLMME